MAIVNGRPGRQQDPYADARRRLQAALAREQLREHTAPSIDELLAQVMELAPLPAVAHRILELSDDQRFSAHGLASIIASDQALTTRLLRLANSAYYGAPRRIGTVRDAVVLLGFRAVQQVALASCIMQNHRPAPHLDYDRFWQFSVTTALLAEVLARTEGEHVDLAFTAGVIHNVGLLALDQHRPDLLREALARAKSDQTSLHEAERALLGYTDADLGGALAEHWNFPAPLVAAVRDHGRLLDDPPEASSLAAHVMRARIFARSYGLSDGLEGRPDAPQPAEDWQKPPLSLSLEHAGGMDTILKRAEAFLEASLR